MTIEKTPKRNYLQVQLGEVDNSQERPTINRFDLESNPIPEVPPVDNTENVNTEPVPSTPVEEPVTTPTPIPQEPVQQPEPISREVQPMDVYAYLCKIGYIENIESVTIGEDIIPITDFLTTDEGLANLLAQYNANNKEALLADTINVSNVDDFRRKIIDVIVNNGDLNTALQAYDNVVNAIPQLDMSTDEGLKTAIFLWHRKQGLPDESIIAMIQGFIQAGMLESQGVSCYDKLLEDDKKRVEQEAETAKQKQKEIAENFKKFKSDLRGSLRDLGISDQKSRSLVDKYIAPNKFGYYIDEVYTSRLDDPKYAADLLLFLDNPDEFIEVRAAEKLNKVKLEQTKALNSHVNGGSMKLTIAEKTVIPKSQETKRATEEAYTPSNGGKNRTPLTAL